MAKILSADDSLTYRTIIKKILTEQGHEVVFCKSGNEALEVFPEVKPDIILLDVEMPGLSGIETCAAFRKMPDSYNVPIAILSSVESVEGILSALTGGADEYIIKPIRKNELIAKMSILLGRRSAMLGGKMPSNVIFGGHYKIKKILGTGGFSSVYLASDTLTNSDVALKVLDASGNTAAEFLREAFGLSILEHPNIVKYIDSGHFGNKCFIATEYIKGTSLKEMIKDKRGSLDSLFVAKIALQVCDALEHISARGLIHRDIKADNIIISEDSSTKIIDFGIAKAAGQKTISIDNELQGTPFYLSPEYIKNHELTYKSDIYSFGVTLFYALSGRFPFNSKDPMVTMHDHLYKVPPTLISINPKAHPTFSKLIAKMLEKDPETRYTFDEIRSFLSTFEI